MKNYLIKIGIPILVTAVAMFATTVNALTITDAGGFDTFIASANLTNSGQATEEAWVANALGLALSDVSMTSKDENGADFWMQFADSNGDDYWYDFGFGVAPEYFVLKLGNGGTSINSHYLFSNVGNTQYAAVSFIEAGVDFSVNNINIGRISHTSQFNGGTSTVPEPTTMLLFGTGIAGLAAVGRRKCK